MRKITCTQFVSKKALGEWFTSILISNYCYLFFLKCYHFALMKKGIWLFSFSFGLTSLPYLFATERFVGSCLNICDDRQKVFLELTTLEKLHNIGQILVGSAEWNQILKGFCNFLQC